jgi:hypothetical protein
VACFSTFRVVSRFQRIHGELLDGDFRVKTKADLIAHYGRPSWTKKMVHDGKETEAWIYEIRVLQPRILRQFEMIDDEITATAATTHIP